MVEVERRADLLDAALAEDDDAVGHGHRLDLIVRHIDDRRFEIAVQLGKLDPHLHAQRRVEVRQRLVEQENLGVAHDGAADGDALALAAGKLAGLAIEQRLELEDSRRGEHFRPPLFLATPASRSAKPMLSATVMWG